MASKIKVDNAVLKRLKRDEQKGRSLNKQAERRYFLIACEGEKTEPNYFIGLKKSLLPGLLEVCDIKIEGTGYNTKSLLALAARLKAKWEHEVRRKIERLWVVFDRDSFDPADFNDTILQCQAQHPAVTAAWTNEAFELWYLLHFENHTSALDRDQYKAKLEAAFKAAGLESFTYQKNSTEMFALLSKYGNPSLAFDRANNLLDLHKGKKDFANHNPCTTVHLMVKEIADLQLTPDAEESQDE